MSTLAQDTNHLAPGHTSNRGQSADSACVRRAAAITGKTGSFSGCLFGQTSDSRIGFWLRRVLAFIAGNLGVHFLPVGVIFRGSRPRRHIFRRTAEPCRYGVRHMASACCESGRNNHQCNQTSHHDIRKRGVKSEKPPPTGEQATGLSNRKTSHSPRAFTSQSPVSELGRCAIFGAREKPR